MSVILSIKPKWAEKILSGEKQIELRKKLWNNKRKIKRAYLYASSPIKKFVGFIDIESVFKERIEFLWLFSKNFSCLSKQEFDKYFSGHSHGSCIVIKEAKRFRNPIDPKEIIPDFKPPQNFCYISKELDKKLMKIEVN